MGLGTQCLGYKIETNMGLGTQYSGYKIVKYGAWNPVFRI